VTRYWVGVVLRDHVQKGVQGGFCQVCHGKKLPLERMKPGDYLVYYSPKQSFGGKEPCQAFTALGRVLERPAYPFALSEDFVPYRRDVEFLETVDAPIAPLLERLEFIPDTQRWGYPFRRGFFEICAADFTLISAAMRPAQLEHNSLSEHTLFL